MNPEPQNPRPELEARLTALLLGELPEQEAATLRQVISRDPELLALEQRLKATIGLVRETAHPCEQGEPQEAPLRLSEERRQKLLAHFKTVRPKEFAKSRWWEVRLRFQAAAAALVIGLLGLALLLPALTKSKSRAQYHSYSFLGSSPGGADSEAVQKGLKNEDISFKSWALNNATRYPMEVTKNGAEPAHRATPWRTILTGGGGGVGGGGVQGQNTDRDGISYTSTELRKNPFIARNSYIAPGATTAVGPLTNIVLPGAEDAFQNGFGGLGVAGSGPATAPGVIEPTTGLPIDTAVISTNSVVLAWQDKTPLLGDVPALGQLMRAKSEAEQKQTQPNRDVYELNVVGYVNLGANITNSALVPSSNLTEQSGLAQRQTAERLGDSLRNLGEKPAIAGLAAPPTRAAAPALSGGATVAVNNAGEVQLTPPLSREAEKQEASILLPKTIPEKGAEDLTKRANRTSGTGDVISGRGESERLIAQQQAVVDDLRNKLQIADSMASADQPAPLITADTLRRLEGLRIESQAEVVKEKTLLDRLQSYKTPEELAEAIPTSGVQDTLLSTLCEDLVVAERRLATSNNDHGPKNSESGKAKNSIDDLKKKINDRVAGLLSGLETRVATSQAALDTLSNEVVKATENDIEKGNASRPYFEAKRKLDELNRFAQVLNMKVLSEGAESNLPKTSIVEITEGAKAGSSESPSLGRRIRGFFGGKDERSAFLRVERDQTDISWMQSPSATSYDPYFIQTEFEAIQSQKVLGKVVKDLKLDEAWANKNGGKKLTSEQAVAMLKKNLDLQAAPKKELIQVGVKADTAGEAARLANAVAQAYRDYRLEERKRLSVAGIAALEARITEQNREVAAAQAEVDRLRQQVLAPTNHVPDAPLTKPAVLAPVPQPEVLTSENAFSTFSLNVSDVSFKLAAASLEKGNLPEPNSIRAEEFINAFDYRDPDPAPGAPVAFAYERAQDPFAQNRDLLRFSIKTAAQGRQSGQPLNVVLLLDNSGSMERADRVRIIQEALRVLATQLHSQDTLSVVTFARTARLFVDGVPGDQAGKVAEEVGGLTPQGGTNLEEAMNLAYQTALRHYLPNGINRVVLLTDGAANLGDVDPESLQKKVEAERKQGIALDCFGIGWEDYNDDLLEVLSRHGDGRYGFINTPEEAASEFAGQLAGALRVEAADVKVQVEFNPNRVTAFRQVGYAKHQLTKEQFRDNTVDAAELGAAEAGNALYVVQVNPTGAGQLATVRVRYKVPGTSDYREQEWSVDYTGAAIALEQASPAMRLSAAAAAFAEWLAASPYAAEMSPDQLIGYVRGVPEVYGADVRPKKLEWMLREAKSLGGK